MSEWHSFAGIVKSQRGDAALLLTTFFLTVAVDLTVAIEIGMIMAAFQFMHRMAHVTNVDLVTDLTADDEDESTDKRNISNFKVPKGVDVFEIKGPFFFGAAYAFKEAMQRSNVRSPKVLILRMRNVPVLDTTGIKTIREVFHQARRAGIKFIISGLQPEPYVLFEKSGLLEEIGKENLCEGIEAALKRAEEVL
jgi:SulP family sulfate permease